MLRLNYAEWPTAVRIDLSHPCGELALSPAPERTLSLAFDPARSCGAEILSGRDARAAVRQFGRKRLRRIVGTIALDQVVPTLVQHRLLTLAA